MGVPCGPGQHIIQRLVPCMLNALPTGIEPDKSSPRTAVGVAVPFTCKQRWFDVQTARGTKQWDLHSVHTLTGWPAAVACRGVELARSVGGIHVENGCGLVMAA